MIYWKNITNWCYHVIDYMQNIILKIQVFVAHEKALHALVYLTML